MRRLQKEPVGEGMDDGNKYGWSTLSSYEKSRTQLHIIKIA
jgi:hypothetical protein